jgi:hypothetical protein
VPNGRTFDRWIWRKLLQPHLDKASRGLQENLDELWTSTVTAKIWTQHLPNTRVSALPLLMPFSTQSPNDVWLGTNCRGLPQLRTVTGYTLLGQDPVSKQGQLICLTKFWGLPILLFSEYRGAWEVHHSPPHKADVKNAWSHASTSVFMVMFRHRQHQNRRMPPSGMLCRVALERTDV